MPACFGTRPSLFGTKTGICSTFNFIARLLFHTLTVIGKNRFSYQRYRVSRVDAWLRDRIFCTNAWMCARATFTRVLCGKRVASRATARVAVREQALQRFYLVMTPIFFCRILSFKRRFRRSSFALTRPYVRNGSLPR